MAPYYVLVKGTPGTAAGSSVEGLDRRDGNFQEIIKKLGFRLRGNQVESVGVSCIVEYTGEAPGRTVLLQPFMYPSAVLNILSEFGLEIVSTIPLDANDGVVLWTLQKNI